MILRKSESIWHKFFLEKANQFYEDIFENQEENSNINLLKYNEAWQYIIKDLKCPHNPKKNERNLSYLSLGNLFRDLRKPLLAAYCYQNSFGFVPSEVFDEANYERNRIRMNKYDCLNDFPKLEKEKAKHERFIDFFNHNLIARTIASLALSTILILLGYFFLIRLKNSEFLTLFSRENHQDIKQVENENIDEVQSDSGLGAQNNIDTSERDLSLQGKGITQANQGINILKQIELSNSDIESEDKLNNAQLDFEHYTLKSIQKLLSEVEEELESDPAFRIEESLSNEDVIRNVVRALLDEMDANLATSEIQIIEKIYGYQNLKSLDEKNELRDIWIGLIAYYQSKNQLDIDGNLGPQTYQSLKTKINFLNYERESEAWDENPANNTLPSSPKPSTSHPTRS